MLLMTDFLKYMRESLTPEQQAEVDARVQEMMKEEGFVLASDSDVKANLTESFSVNDLQAAVKFSRNTGYFLHDIRNPEFFTRDQNEQIKELDQAFLTAASSNDFTFEQMAGFGESDSALAVTDDVADKLISQTPNEIIFTSENIYDVAFPMFKVAMKSWFKDLKPKDLESITNYWQTKK